MADRNAANVERIHADKMKHVSTQTVSKKEIYGHSKLGLKSDVVATPASSRKPSNVKRRTSTDATMKATHAGIDDDSKDLSRIVCLAPEGVDGNETTALQSIEETTAIPSQGNAQGKTGGVHRVGKKSPLRKSRSQKLGKPDHDKSDSDKRHHKGT